MTRTHALVALLGAAGVALSTFPFLSTARADGRDLPEKRPAELVLRHEWHYAMRGDAGNVVISANGGTYAHGHTREPVAHPFDVDAKDLDALYAVLRELRDAAVAPEPSRPKGSKPRLDDDPSGDGNSITAEWSGGKVVFGGAGKVLDAFESYEKRVEAALKVEVVVVLAPALAERPHRLLIDREVVLDTLDPKNASAPVARTVVALACGKRALRFDVEGKTIAVPELTVTTESVGVRLVPKGDAIALEALDRKVGLFRLDADAAAAHGLPRARVLIDVGDSGLEPPRLTPTGVQASGAPGGPLGLSLESYTGLGDGTDQLAQLAAKRFGERSHEPGSSGRVSIGGADRWACTGVTGGGPARSVYLMVLFPKAAGADSGILLTVEVGEARDPAPTPAVFVEKKSFRDLLRSMRIAFR